jgi:dienelactone hydrolase
MLVLAVALAAGQVGAQEYYGDFRPDAPELAARGPLQVGVRTLVAEHKDQLDILHATAEKPNPRYNRKLTLEVWYPARLADGQREHTVYTDVLGSGANDPKRPNTPFQFNGRAARDAAPAAAHGGRYPLVIVSHGYPGSRLQMSYLTENLASKGYVVVAIDHLESTRADKAGFPSTLLNRRLDDLFVLDTVAAWAKPGSGNFLAGVVDADNTALIGYSMGGYGALNAVGAGISASAVAYVPGGSLAINQQGNQQYEAQRDPRIKAVVAFAMGRRQPGVGRGGTGGRTHTNAVHQRRPGRRGRLQGWRAQVVRGHGARRPLPVDLCRRPSQLGAQPGVACGLE